MEKDFNLPVHQPSILSYTGHALPLSINSEINNENYLHWLYSNYYQIVCHTHFLQNRLALDFYHNSKFNNPWIETQYISKENIINFEKRIIDNFINWLLNGNYLLLTLDMYYIPKRFKYKKDHYYHNELIYGYNLNSKTFKIYGFGKDGKLVKTTIEFEKIKYATRFTKEIFLMKKEESSNYILDLQNIIEQISEYLSSKNSSERFRSYKVPTTQLTYGIDTYDILIDFFEHYIKGELPDDIYSMFIRIRKQIYVFWEHKKCLLERIRFMEKKGIIKGISILYSTIESDARIIMHHLLKSNLLNDRSIFCNAIILLSELKSKEKEILLKMLFSLKEYNKTSPIIS